MSVRRVIVISDIHMGAENGRGIFSSEDALVSFVDRLSTGARDTHLVILGDALDFLQVKPYLDFRTKPAVDKIGQIIEKNKKVFRALGGFAGEPGNKVVWSIGNHDIELTFREVRAEIANAILGKRDLAQGDPLEFRLDGLHIDYDLPRVGKLRLAHGNRHDLWNAIDYGDAAAVAAQGGRADYTYPAGSRLVAHVLNPLKDQGFLHVDLLKPEDTVALPLTLALWPKETWSLLQKAFPAFSDVTLGGVERQVDRAFGGAVARGFGTDGGAASAPAEPVTAESLVMAALRDGIRVKERADARADLLALLSDEGAEQAELAFETKPGAPRAFGGPAWYQRLLSKMLRGVAWQQNTNSDPFAADTRDALDPDVIASFQDGATILVAGHTHLARAVNYPAGYYFNTGTWADLLRIPMYVSKKELDEHGAELRAYFEHPERAPSELRPFRRLTYVDVLLEEQSSGAAFSASLCEYRPTPEALIRAFP